MKFGWKKVKKELKKEDLLSSHVQLKGNQTFNPFFEPDLNVKKQSIKGFPELSIGVALNLSEEDANRSLMHLLQYDLRLFQLSTDHDTDLDKVLENVYRDMVFIDIKGGSNSMPDFLNSQLQSENGFKDYSIPAEFMNDDFARLGCYCSWDFTGENDTVEILKQCKQLWLSLAQTNCYLQSENSMQHIRKSAGYHSFFSCFAAVV